ncbi:UNVERIFIED_CONTAM: Benzyl alcohol O-benzoyltransferase [Sesamum latifolium]|uniref:Benzyl alcohol O-benzoyltransferase n=1 Tax=Sesamum latifolium TaxID=2727402 RepID=A0AAW2TPJ2_9LAMI
MSAVGELTHGAKIPSVQPVWRRDLLSARDPPHIFCTHHEYDEVPNAEGTLIPPDDMVYRSFFFDEAEIFSFLPAPPSAPPSLLHLRTPNSLPLALPYNRDLSRS